MQVAAVNVVVESGKSPAGRNPLSASMSHSSPSTPAGSVATWPDESAAIPVLRQNRILPSACDTVMELLCGELTQGSVPLSPFSGRPPSAGGLKRESRHIPVQVGGSSGSMTAPARDSL